MAKYAGRPRTRYRDLVDLVLITLRHDRMRAANHRRSRASLAMTLVLSRRAMFPFRSQGPPTILVLIELIQLGVDRPPARPVTP